MKETQETSGVQELIDKLKNQGVSEGQRQADQIIKDAHNKASCILSKAQTEADQLLSEARHTLEVERKSSHEAIKMAFRDTEIALRTKVREAFSAHLKRLVSIELTDKDFIKQLVLAIASKKAPDIAQAPHVEILLPSQLVETDERGSLLSKKGKERMEHLVLGITHEMLREGIELHSSTDVKAGIKVRLTGKDIELNLTDEALSNLLLKYLLPRYREIVSGSINER